MRTCKVVLPSKLNQAQHLCVSPGESSRYPLWSQMSLDINECAQKESQMYFVIYI